VSHYSGWHFFGHNSPAARELFKPSTDSASLLVKMEEKRFLFLVGVYWGDPPQVEVFWKLWLPLHSLGPQPIDPFF